MPPRALPALFALLLCAVCAASSRAQPAELKILVLGTSQPLRSAEAAFPPAGVADQLRQILVADPALSGTAVTVTAHDLYRNQPYTRTVSGLTFNVTHHSRTLMSGYFWPQARAATDALLAQDWDHVVLIEDPFVASRYPEYMFEGVRAFARAARQSGAQPHLLMTWTSAASPGATNNTARFAEMAYRVGAATGVPVVPAGYAWANLAPALRGTGTRPNLPGNYTAAAALYSHLTARSASTSPYVPASLDSPARATLADTALAAVQTAPGQTHFTGTHLGPTRFVSPLLKKRSFTYTDFNSSTEWGYRGGLAAVLSLARMDWSQTFAGYQSLPTTGFPYDFAQTRYWYDSDPDLWRAFATFDFQDRDGAESMITGIDRVLYSDPLPEQPTSAANIPPASSAPGTFFVPVRVLWSRLSTEQPSIPAQPDGHHLSDEYNQGVASLMFTLLTGRCAVGTAPADPASLDWRRWYARKTGYEIAWQYATLQERVPGFEVLPASTTASTLAPGASTTLSVRFLYPPTANVTVAVAVDNPLAATASPASLTFTPQNFNVAQTVTLTGLAGASASDNFNAVVTTSSTDPVFHALSDTWAYTTLRPASGTWTADTSGTWTDTTKWASAAVANGTGTADFSTLDLTADRTVQLDAPLSINRLLFADTNPTSPAGWLLAPNGNPANTLTLAGTTPAITVNTLAPGKTATVSTVLAGTNGLVKNGPGTLVLSALNTYTGGTTVAGGTLELAAGGPAGSLRGALSAQPGATIRSTVASSFGYALNTRVDSLALNSASLLHQVPGATLTFSSVTVQLTGSTLDSTGSAGFDFFDASALGGPNVNTSLASLASTAPSTLAGRVNLRAGDNDATGTVFTVADGAASDDLVVSAVLANGSAQGAASRIQKSGTGRMLLSAANTYTGGTLLNAGTLVAAHPSAFGASGTVEITASSGATLELATPDGSLATPYALTMGSGRANTVLVNRATPGSADYSLGTLSLGASTLTFNTGPQISGAHTGLVRLASLDLSAGNNNQPVTLNGNTPLAIGSAAILSNNSLSKRLQLDGTALANTLGPVANGPGTGILSLIKAGLGKWTLTGANTYTGSTTITQGELALATPSLPDAANVSVSTGSILHLAFTGTDFIGSLTLGGTPATPGTWGSLTSTAPNRTTHLTGPGTVTILPAAYATWANTHALGSSPAQRAPLSDPDADGLPNLLEFTFGSSPSSPSSADLGHQVLGLRPQGSSFTFTFPRSPASLGLVPLTVEWSTDLVTWNSLPVSAASSGPDALGITITITAQPAAPDSVTVAFPSTLSPSGRLFTRLRASSF